MLMIFLGDQNTQFTFSLNYCSRMSQIIHDRFRRACDFNVHKIVVDTLDHPHCSCETATVCSLQYM